MANRHAHIAGNGPQMGPQKHVTAPRRHEQRGQRQQRRDRHDQQNAYRPSDRCRHRHEPAADQRCRDGRRNQRPAQVVEHLGAPVAGQPIDGRAPAGEDPRQQLPVASHPAVLAAYRGVVADRKVLDDFDIGYQPSACKCAFEQIVAEHGVFRHPPGQRRHEAVDFIDALASERSFTQQVLVEIGRCRRIGIDSRRPSRQSFKRRLAAPHRQRHGNARLHDAIARDHPPQGDIEARAVQRVRHLADHLLRRAKRQLRIGIEGDDIANARGHHRRSAIRILERGVGCAAQQSVELVQLAALALPAHPAAFSRIELPAAVKKHEARRTTLEGVARIKGIYGGTGTLEPLILAGKGFAVGIGKIGQQCIKNRILACRQVMDLKVADRLANPHIGAQQHRNDHQRPQLRADATLKRQRGDDSGRQQRCHHAIDHRRCCLDGQNHQGGEHRQRQPRRQHGFAQTGERHQRQQHRHQRYQRNIELDAAFPDLAGQPGFNRRHIANVVFECGTTAADQVESRILVGTVVAHARAGQPDRPRRHGILGIIRAARQLLQRVAVEIARREIHRGKIAAAAQHPINKAQRFNHLAPIGLGDGAHGDDDIADGGGRGDQSRLCHAVDLRDGPPAADCVGGQPTPHQLAAVVHVAQSQRQLANKRR